MYGDAASAAPPTTRLTTGPLKAAVPADPATRFKNSRRFISSGMLAAGVGVATLLNGSLGTTNSLLGVYGSISGSLASTPRRYSPHQSPEYVLGQSAVPS